MRAQWRLGPYVVRSAPRSDNPRFEQHSIFRRGRLVGRQFSVPTLSDARWLEHGHGRYATASESFSEFKKYGYLSPNGLGTRKRAAAK